MYLSIGFRKSTPSRNRQLILYYHQLKYQVDGFVMYSLNLESGAQVSVMLTVQGGSHAAATSRHGIIANLIYRIHFIFKMIQWTGLAPWELEFPFPGSFISTLL